MSTIIYRGVEIAADSETIAFSSADTATSPSATVSQGLITSGDDVATQILKLSQISQNVRKLLNTGTNSSTLGNVTSRVATLSGNTVTIRWADPADVTDASGNVILRWSHTVLMRRVSSVPTSIDDSSATVVVVSATRDQYKTTGYVDTDLVYGKKYYYRWFVVSTTGAVTVGSNFNRTPTRTSVAIPTQTNYISYDGYFHSPTFSSTVGYTITSGVTCEASQGTYSIVCDLLPGYQWSDGTTAAKTVTWSIGSSSASGSSQIELSESEIIVDTFQTSVWITVSNLRGRSIASAVSSSESVGTFIFNNRVCISNDGEVNESGVTVTIMTNDSGVYGVSTATVSVTAAWYESTDLNDLSWAAIQTVAQRRLGSSWWSVGDTKSISFSGTFRGQDYDTTVDVFILGFDHNSDVEGTGISFQVGKLTSSGVKVGWRSDTLATPTGGTGTDSVTATGIYHNSSSVYRYHGSFMHTVVLPEFKACLPEELQAVIKPAVKWTDGKKLNLTAASSETDMMCAEYDLFLLAACEISGGSAGSPYEYKNGREAQYAYYAVPNNAYVVNINNQSQYVRWWTRTRYVKSTNFVVYYTTAESVTTRSSTGVARYLSEAVFPAFLVG